MGVGRLVNRTAIEIEGWKRIPAIRRLFLAANLEINDYVLKSEAVDHPLLKYVRRFQDQFLPNDPQKQILHPKTLNVLKQDECIIANLVNVNGAAGSVSHAVLFDKNKTDSQNDDQYYFKNSYGPNEPYIIIPKNRGTFQHFNLLNRYASHPNSASMAQ